MYKYSIIFALMLLGITAIITQVVLIRELIVIFSGNELSIGIILANLLILQALGSYVAGLWATKKNSACFSYTILQAFLALLLPIVIYLARIIPSNLNLVPGEAPDIITIFGISFLLLIPIGLINGAQFNFGCKLLANLEERSASLIGRVYAFEAIGSVVGGIIATYICLQYLNAFQTVFILSFLNLISALLLLNYTFDKDIETHKKKLRVAKLFHGGLLILFFLFVLTGKIEQLHQDSIKKQWPDYKIVSYENSIFGNTTFLERFEQWHLLSNGVSIATVPTPQIAQIEDMAHFPLLAHPDPKNIFFLGGGLAGVIEEILKYQILSIDYAELDPLLIKTIHSFAPDSIVSTLKSPLINTHFVDGRYFLRITEKKYDIIILNIPAPSTLILNRFFTTEFFQLCKTRLNKNGLLVCQIPGSSSYMNVPLIKLTNCILNSVSPSFRYQRILPFEQTLVIASNERSVFEISPGKLAKRLEQRRIKTKLFSDLYLKYKLDTTRVIWFNDERERAHSTRLNKDLVPAALYYNLIYWNSSLSPIIASFYSWFENLSFVHVLLFILLIFSAYLFLQLKGKIDPKSALISAISSTGLIGMGLTIILLLVFQAYYGYVYFWIGLLISAFMVGLAAGGLWGSKYVKQKNDSLSLFYNLERLIAIYLFIVTICLLSIHHMIKMDILYTLFPFIILVFTLICGGLVGAQFPVASQIYLKSPSQFAQTAGVIYASDLVGAWVGGILITLLFIPILGAIETAFILFIIKLCSTIIFRRVGK